MGETDQLQPIDHGICMGRVHRKVPDLERSLRSYRPVLGFPLTQEYGHHGAFIAAGGYHHQSGLNTWESHGGPAPGTTGLRHVAILDPTRSSLAVALRRLLVAGVRLDGASDPGVSEALHLGDPDDNGVELKWERRREAWPRTPDDRLAMFTRPLDLRGPLGEPEAQADAPEVEPGPQTCERATGGPLHGAQTRTGKDRSVGNMQRISLGRYRHYKGKNYTVLGVARHSETLEELVVYQQDYGDRSLWVRPLPMFLETVEVDGQAVPRFRYVEGDD